MDLISRKDAEVAGLKHYFTGKPCKRGHLAFRFVSVGNYTVCSGENARKWREKNPHKHPQYSRDWVTENRERHNEKSRQWRDRNPEKARENGRLSTQKWVRENPERAREWFLKNLERLRAYNAARRARKLQATPVWADLETIRQIYLNCPPGHHVDHVVP